MRMATVADMLGSIFSVLSRVTSTAYRVTPLLLVPVFSMDVTWPLKGSSLMEEMVMDAVWPSSTAKMFDSSMEALTITFSWGCSTAKVHSAGVSAPSTVSCSSVMDDTLPERGARMTPSLYREMSSFSSSSSCARCCRRAS